MIKAKLTLLAMAVSCLVAEFGYADGSEWCGGYNWSYWAENYVPVYGGVAVAGRNMISPAPTGSIEVPASLGGYPVAAINELRYAGHHVLEASQADDEAEVEDHIASARNHCRRAVNDAVV